MMHFSDLSLATTTHNNYQMLATMLSSFETNLGTVDKIVIVDDGSRRPSALPPVSSGVRLIRNELKEKVGRDEFLVLEKRVAALERASRRQ